MISKIIICHSELKLVVHRELLTVGMGKRAFHWLCITSTVARADMLVPHGVALAVPSVIDSGTIAVLSCNARWLAQSQSRNCEIKR